MIHRTLCWPHRHLFALFLAISLAIIITIPLVVFNVFATFSSNDAKNITSRSSQLLARHMASDDILGLHAMGRAIISNPSVHSIQTYSVHTTKGLLPIYGKIDHAPVDAGWHTVALMPLLKPFFYHRHSTSITLGDERLGSITLHFRDFARAEAALGLSLTLCLIALLNGLVLFLRSLWWKKGYHQLVMLVHKEAYADTLLDGSRFYALRHYPSLQRLHSLIRRKKTERKGLLDELHRKDQQIIMYEDLMKKAHHQNEAHHLTSTKAPIFDHEEIEYLISLTHHLSESIKDPQHRATAGLVYRSLATQAAQSQWSISPHGEIDIVHLISILHQSTCERRNPPVMLIPHIDGNTGFQGNITDIMRVTHALLDLGTSNSHLGGHLRLYLGQHPKSSHMMLTCHLSDPMARDSESHSSQVTQRQSFIDFKRHMESANAKVSIKVCSDTTLDIQVTLPLLPTKKVAYRDVPSLEDRGVFVIQNGPRSISLHQAYQKMGTSVSLVDASDIGSIASGVAIFINEDGKCDELLTDMLKEHGHQVIVIGDSLSMQKCRTEDALSYLDLHTPLLYHLEHIDLLTRPDAPALLFKNSSVALEGKSTLGQLADLISHKQNPSTLWIPLTMTPLAKASLTTPLRDQDFTVKEYDPNHCRTLPSQDGDILFVDPLTARHGVPSSSLGGSPSMILVIAQSDDCSDVEQIEDVKHVISLPVDTGYLTSIVQRAGHLQ